MTHYQMAKIGRLEGVVLDNYTILNHFRCLSEQTKMELLSYYLDTRTDRYLVLFPTGDLRLFRPDDVEVTWHYDEVA